LPDTYNDIKELEGETMLTWIITAILALVILFISRHSVLKPRSHGFWRFFAWEFMLVLAAINIKTWFIHPWSWHQIISWVLLFGCFVPLIYGIRSLVERGKPVEQRAGEPQLLAFEKTSTLVTTGIYHYIRHPLYSSLLLLAWGIFFKSPSWLGTGLVLAASACLYLTARADEAECIRFFGESYRDYMKKTKRFIPFCF
jgi:protein-S-isoprenylcysteine O-methyltransferase Ste14